MSGSEHNGHHIIPYATYLKTFGALLVLTVLTVLVSYVDFGAASIFVAVGIAAVKAGLVAMFFMGLKYDNKVNSLIFLASLAFVAIFLAFTLIDSSQRNIEEMTPTGSQLSNPEQVEGGHSSGH